MGIDSMEEELYERRAGICKAFANPCPPEDPRFISDQNAYPVSNCAADWACAKPIFPSTLRY